MSRLPAWATPTFSPDLAQTFEEHILAHEAFGVMLLSGAHDRALTAFSLAAGAAALGQGCGDFRVQPGVPGDGRGLVGP